MLFRSTAVNRLNKSVALPGRSCPPSACPDPVFGVAVRNFGIMQEYNERRNKKLINNCLLTDRPMYWVTSARPSNFGDPLDAKTKADNWFDENR